MPLKKSNRHIFIYGLIAVCAISLTTIFSLFEIRHEAARQAVRLQESHLRTFWVMLREKGSPMAVVNGRLLAGDYVINGDFQLPDRIKELFGGVATIFMGDVRVSTNVLLPDGSRAVGVRLTGPAREALFVKGRSYRGESTILGTPYFVAYDPIRDARGKVIGALFVGVRQETFLAGYNKLKLAVVAIHLLLAASLIILSVLLLRKRKMSERRIRESEELLRMAFEGSNYGAWDIDLVRREIRHNQRWADILGYDAKESAMPLDRWRELIHPDDLPEFLREYHEHLEGKTERYVAEYRTLGKSGQWMWFMDRGKVVERDAAGAPLRMAGTSADVTARKQAEEALRASEANYRAIFDAANDAIIVHDMDTGKVVDVNRRMCEMYGYTREEALRLGEGALRASEGDSVRDIALERMRMADAGDSDFFECLARAGDGREFWAEVSLKRAVIGGRERLLEVVRDMSARKKAEEERDRLEEQLRQAQKIEAVGQLAGGIAHDFNNVLTAIIGYAHLIIMKMTGDNQPVHFVEQILGAAERAAGLTQGLLAFSRKQVINPQNVDLNGIVQNMRTFMERIIGEDIEQQISLHERELPIFADIGQIEQVLMNLATNARDAMPNGGVLRIRTGLLEIQRDGVDMPGGAEPIRFACLSVSDTGSGISEKDREKLFEPFFTTKEVGQGTGLGLSIAYGIVKEHKGYIEVASEEGQGTTFHVYLPLVSGGKSNIFGELFSPPSGVETILVAEDDEEVRKLAGSLLEECGYTVIEAVDGVDAVARFEENAERIRLIILDVVMPKKNGNEVYDDIRRICPEARTIFMSGYSSDIINKKGFIEQGLDFIEKPIIPLTFLNKVREVLDRDV